MGILRGDLIIYDPLFVTAVFEFPLTGHLKSEFVRLEFVRHGNLPPGQRP
jgi:hypothetical protein